MKSLPYQAHMTNEEILKKISGAYSQFNLERLNETKEIRKELLEFYLSDMHVWHDYFFAREIFNKRFHLFDIAHSFNKNWILSEADESKINGITTLTSVDKIIIRFWLNWNSHRIEIMEQSSIFCDPYIHLDRMIELGGWQFGIDGSGMMFTHTSVVNPRHREGLAKYTGTYPI